jgi:uncharacterized protein YndB with AHSA1/START domain
MAAQFKPTFVYVIYISAAPERVWEALTQPEFTSRFFFGRTVESDWRVGSPWLLRMPDGRIDVQGEVLEADPPRRLKLTWNVVWDEAMAALPPTHVTYDIEPVGEAVRLTMTQANDVAPEERFLEGGRQGWPMILSGLKSLVETGRPLGLPVPAPPQG